MLSRKKNSWYVLKQNLFENIKPSGESVRVGPKPIYIPFFVVLHLKTKKL